MARNVCVACLSLSDSQPVLQRYNTGRYPTEDGDDEATDVAVEAEVAASTPNASRAERIMLAERPRRRNRNKKPWGGLHL